MVYHCQQDRRYDIDICDLVLLDAREEKPRLELGHNDNRNSNQEVVVNGLDGS
jgi:hypothetical protein